MDRVSAAPDSFDEVLGPLVSKGYALAFTMLDDKSAAEDAVQEASIRAWRKIHTLRDHTSHTAWFLSIVANQCRSVRRTRWWKVVKVADLRPLPLAEEPPWTEVLDLERAVQLLTPEERAPLLLHFYLDMTFEQVGAVLGLSMTAARSRVYRALDRLRLSMDPAGSVANA